MDEFRIGLGVVDEGKEEIRWSPKLLQYATGWWCHLLRWNSAGRQTGARGGNRAFGCGHAEAGTPTDIQAEMSGWRFEPMERARWELSMNT